MDRYHQTMHPRSTPAPSEEDRRARVSELERRSVFLRVLRMGFALSVSDRFTRTGRTRYTRTNRPLRLRGRTSCCVRTEHKFSSGTGPACAAPGSMAPRGRASPVRVRRRCRSSLSSHHPFLRDRRPSRASPASPGALCHDPVIHAPPQPEDARWLAARGGKAARSETIPHRPTRGARTGPNHEGSGRAPLLRRR